MKKILYIVDDINYNSGAKMATLFQMKQLQGEYDIWLLSLVRPEQMNETSFLRQDHVLYPKLWKLTEVYATSFRKALKNKKYSIKEKVSRVIYTVGLRFGYGEKYLAHMIEREIKDHLEDFDAVIVVSESSKLRGIVSRLKKPKKIQWIHTDYAHWCEYSEWSKAVTRNDRELYQKYDTVVTLSENCKKGIINKIPEIRDKIVVIPNLIDGDRILRMAAEECEVNISEEYLNLVTVARIDKEKQIDKLIELAKQMMKMNVHFKWFVIGDGPERDKLEALSVRYKVDRAVCFLGHMANPYPVMKRCDALILISKYEGMPVTIEEAMILGINVVASNVGGIMEQVRGYPKASLLNKESDLIKVLATIKKNNFENRRGNAYIERRRATLNKIKKMLDTK